MIGSLVAMTLAAPVAADDPDGDYPAGAIPIVAIGAPQAYDTSAATANEVTDPAACDGESGHFDGPFTNTFWHSFTAAADGDLIVDVNSFPDPEADGFLAIVFVVEDDGAGGFSLVACSAFGSTVRFAAVAGTTYYAMTGSLPETPVGGPAIITILEPFVSNLTVSERATYDQATNGVTIHGTVECASPANLEVSVFGSQQVGSHLLSGDGFAPAGECDGEHVWSVTIFAFNSFFNPGELEVFVEVFACTAICSGDFGTATVRARPGKPVSVEPPPPPPANDEREGAVPIGLDETAEQDTNGATANAADPGECPDQPIVVFSTATVWYSFSTTESGFVEINTFGSDYDTTLFVLQGDTIVACNDQAGESNQSRLSFAADGAYDIMIGAWQDSPPGNLVLNVVAGDEPPPPPPAPDNDERDSPVEIVVDGAVLEADTTSATSDEATDPQACPDLPDLPASEHTVWYAISGHDGWVEVNTFDSDFDTTLYVLDGNDVVACDDDTESRQSRVVFLADPAATYEVMAGTFDGSDGGNLVIRALSSEEPPPPPEPFEFIFTLNDVGTVNTRTGEVTIGGTIACSSDASGFMFASSFQEGGRFVADGFAEGELACNEEPAPWSLTIFGSTTKFQAGEAFVGVDAFVQTEDGAGAGTFVESIVRLVPVGSAR
jgi:hypothetical protein